MIIEAGSYIAERHLPFKPGAGTRAPGETTAPGTGRGGMSLEAMEKAMLLEALKKVKGNKSEAARILETTRDTLRYKIKKYGISVGGKTD